MPIDLKKIHNFGEQADDIWSFLGRDFVESQLARNPSDPQAWLMGAHSRFYCGDLKGFQDAIEKVLALDTVGQFNRPALGGLYYSLALEAGRAGNSSLLFNAAKRAEELGFFPSITPLQEAALSFELGNAYFFSLKYQEAIKEFKVVVSINPVHKRATVLLAHAYFEAGELHLARDMYVQCLRLGITDAQIALNLDFIEYTFPVSWEKESPQNVDPYMRAAISYVYDRWLYSSLTRQTSAGRIAHEKLLLDQVTTQCKGYLREEGKSIHLNVPVMLITEELARELCPSNDSGEMNETQRRYSNVIRETVARFKNSNAASQTRVFKLAPGVVRKLRRGLQPTWVTFKSMTPPHYFVSLDFTFHKEPASNASRALFLHRHARQMQNETSYEVRMDGRVFRVPFVGSKSYFASGATEETRLCSLGQIEEHIRKMGSVFLLDHYDAHDIADDQNNTNLSRPLRDSIVGAIQQVGYFCFKIIVGTKCLSRVRNGEHLGGIRLVQDAPLKDVYAIIYLIGEDGPNPGYRARFTFDAIIGKDGKRLGGMQ